MRELPKSTKCYLKGKNYAWNLGVNDQSLNPAAYTLLC